MLSLSLSLSLSLALSLSLSVHALLVVGWQNEKKENDRSVCRREEMGFQFWLKRVKKHAWQRGRAFQVMGPTYQKDLSSRVLSIITTQNIWSWVKRARRRGEMKQLTDVYGGTVPETMRKQVKPVLYWILLLIGSQWRSQNKGCGQMRWTEQLIIR